MAISQKDADFDAEATNKLRQLKINSINSSILDASTRMHLLESTYRHQLYIWHRSRGIASCESSKSVIAEKLQRFCYAKAGLIYATAQTHKEVAQLIADNPSPRQRKLRAALAYRQFIDIVKVFVGLRSVF